MPPGLEDSARVAQEVKVDGVDDDAGGGREFADHVQVSVGDVPEGEEREVEVSVTNQFLGACVERPVGGHAALLQGPGRSARRLGRSRG